MKFKAWRRPAQAEGRGARKGIRVGPGCGDGPESLRGQPGYLEGAQGNWG